MNKRAIRADGLLLLTSGIWGVAFVAQRTGMDYVGPFTFNGIRFILGSFSLLPLIIVRNLTHQSDKPASMLTRIGSEKRAWIGPSMLAGTCLCIAASLQQIGIIYTTAGHSGFITGLYVVLVPLFGIALKRKTGLATWIGAVWTLTGLFFLSTEGNMNTINFGDGITAVGAIFWAFHVLLIDRLVQKVDPLILSAGQFAWCGICSSALACLGTESFSWGIAVQGLVPILYSGLGSVGIAYTLQVVAQQDAPPAHATIILCLEGVFAALGGCLILAEPLGSWTILGFICMFCGMVATQWELITRRAQAS
ncbi:MAG: DMT family transporter [Treponema sp.]|jgi:drug/metabolite transporter (DMT)-like permease|nr:DMT family transporter [Treponema sp.]